MISTAAKPVPFVALRHAKVGRLGMDGRLPHGWSGEHTTEVVVEDVNPAGERPTVTLSLKFSGSAQSDFVGICVGQYLPVPRDAVVVLASEISFERRQNVAAGFVLLREFEEGGEFVRQSTRPLKLVDEPQIGLVAHEVQGDNRVIQPVILVRRQSAADGELSVTLRGLAFGNLYDNPRWILG
jgi:hypothetical protein